MSDKSEESILPYDYLILSTGLQYCFDEPGHGDIPEKGVFTLQGDSCDEKVLEKTKELIANNGNIYLPKLFIYLSIYLFVCSQEKLLCMVHLLRLSHFWHISLI